MKLACRVEEDSESEVPTKGKGKAWVTPVVAEDQIPGLVNFFGLVTESLKLLVEEARHTNALLFNLSATSLKTQNSLGTSRIYFSRFAGVRV